MVFTLCKAEQPLEGMKLQESEGEKEEKFGKEKWKDDYKETKNEMCLLTQDKKSSIHHTRVQEQISTPSDFSVAS